MRVMQWIFIAILFLLIQSPLEAQSSQQSGFHETLRIGRGAVLHVEWHPDGERIMVDTIRGAWFYSSDGRRLVDWGHIEDARAARYSPDGRTIAGVNEQYEITLWDAYTLNPITQLSGHDVYIRSVAWRPDSNLLASLDRTGRIIIWNISSGQASLEFHLDGADEIAWSAGGTYLAAVDYQTGIFNVWDTTGELILTSTPEYPNSYGFDILWRNDTQLLRRSYGEVPVGMMWDIAAGTSRDFPPIGYASDFSPDGTKLAAAYIGRALIVDAETGDTLLSTESTYAFVVEWSPDGETIAFGDWTGSVHNDAHVIIIDSETGEIVQSLAYDFTIDGIYWSPDGEAFIVVDSASQIYISSATFPLSIAHTEIGNVAAWRSDGQVIAAADTNLGARLWDADTGALLIPRMNQGQPASRLIWQPGGTLLATAVGNGFDHAHNNVYIWDSTMISGSAVDPVFAIPHVSRVAAISWSPDGRTLASAEGGQYLRLWQPDVPDTIRVINSRAIRLTPYVDYTQRFPQLGWSPNSEILYIFYSPSGNWHGIQLIDVATASFSVSDTPPSFANTWVWTPDNRLIWARWSPYNAVTPIDDIAVGGQGITDQYTDDEQPPLVLSGLDGLVSSGTFSPDARLLIGFDGLDSAVIWDIETQTPLVHLPEVHHAVWSPDSTMIVVYGTDGVIDVIDPFTGETIHTFSQHFGDEHLIFRGEYQVIWSPNSRRIALLDRGVLFLYDF